MNCRNIKALGIAAVAIFLTSCSSKKYESWSECMSEEISKNNNVAAAEAYCDANYDMTQREQVARKVWSCKGHIDPQSCMAETVQVPAVEVEQAPPPFDASAAPYEKGEEPVVGTRVGRYEFKGGDPNLQENWVKHDK